MGVSHNRNVSYTIVIVNGPQCELCLFFIPNINPISSFEVKCVRGDRGHSSHVAVAAYFLFVKILFLALRHQLVSTHGSNAVSWLLISLYSTDNLFLCCCYCIACRLWHGRPAAATQTALAGS